MIFDGPDNPPFIGEVVQTGPDPADYGAHWHNINPASRQIVATRIVSNVTPFADAGKAENEPDFEIYPAGADAKQITFVTRRALQ